MSDHAFVSAVLEALKGQAEKASQKFPPLHHMLVLPAGVDLLVPRGEISWPIPSPCGDTAAEFAGQKIAGPLPPTACWPKGLLPAVALSTETPIVQFDDWRGRVREPYRLHLFFGADEGLQEFAQIAAGLMDVQRDLGSAIFHDNSGARIHGARAVEHAQELDAWLCTSHWWAWRCPDSPLWTRPRVVMGEKGIEAAHLEPAVNERLSFSLLPCDVFAASVSMIDLLLQFLAVPPDLAWKASYPPEASQTPAGSDGTAEAASAPKSDQTPSEREQGNGEAQTAQAPAEGQQDTGKHVPPLTEAQQEVYNLIRNEGPLQGPEIVRLIGMGSESTLTAHYIPAIKKAGILNRRGLGYYHPDTYDPDEPSQPS